MSSISPTNSFLSRFQGKVNLRQEDGSSSPLKSPIENAPISNIPTRTQKGPTNRRLQASTGATRQQNPEQAVQEVIANPSKTNIPNNYTNRNNIKPPSTIKVPSPQKENQSYIPGGYASSISDSGAPMPPTTMSSYMPPPSYMAPEIPQQSLNNQNNYQNNQNKIQSNVMNHDKKDQYMYNNDDGFINNNHHHQNQKSYESTQQTNLNTNSNSNTRTKKTSRPGVGDLQKLLVQGLNSPSNITQQQQHNFGYNNNNNNNNNGNQHQNDNSKQIQMPSDYRIESIKQSILNEKQLHNNNNYETNNHSSSYANNYSHNNHNNQQYQQQQYQQHNNNSNKFSDYQPYAAPPIQQQQQQQPNIQFDENDTLDMHLSNAGVLSPKTRVNEQPLHQRKTAHQQTQNYHGAHGYQSLNQHSPHRVTEDGYIEDEEDRNYFDDDGNELNDDDNDVDAPIVYSYAAQHQEKISPIKPSGPSGSSNENKDNFNHNNDNNNGGRRGRRQGQEEEGDGDGFDSDDDSGGLGSINELDQGNNGGGGGSYASHMKNKKKGSSHESSPPSKTKQKEGSTSNKKGSHPPPPVTYPKRGGAFGSSVDRNLDPKKKINNHHINHKNNNNHIQNKAGHNNSLSLNTSSNYLHSNHQGGGGGNRSHQHRHHNGTQGHQGQYSNISNKISPLKEKFDLKHPNPNPNGFDGINKVPMKKVVNGEDITLTKEDVNLRMIKNQEDQLFFSKKARPVNYEPCTLNQYQREKADQYQEIKGSVHKPNLDREDIAAKRANAQRIKEFAKKLNNVNMSDQSHATVPKRATPEEEMKLQKQKRELTAREKAAQFALQIPKPKVMNHDKNRGNGNGTGGPRQKSAPSEMTSSGSRRVMKEDSPSKLDALELKHDNARAQIEQMRREFGM